MKSRFLRARRRLYTLAEVVAYRCKHDPSWKGPKKKAECRARVLKDHADHPFWERRKVSVAQLWYDLRVESDPKTAEYVEQRRAGRAFPAVLVVHSRKFPGQFVLHDGHHRVCAAKRVGDEFIDAFVPAR